MANQKFYYCEKCKNLLAVFNDGGGVPTCCGEEMKLLTANTVDASQEKHVPYVTRDGKNLHVQIGEEEHPMTDAHWIQWILVVQGDHSQRVVLHPEEKPVADFQLSDASAPVTVYEYCNLHGLWVIEG